jgi:hypothetical protein
VRRDPALSWEYGPKAREILAARDPAAFLEKPVAVEQFEEGRLTLLPNDPEEGSWKSGAEEVALVGGSATAATE